MKFVYYYSTTDSIVATRNKTLSKQLISDSKNLDQEFFCLCPFSVKTKCKCKAYLTPTTELGITGKDTWIYETYQRWKSDSDKLEASREAQLWAWASDEADFNLSEPIPHEESSNMKWTCECKCRDCTSLILLTFYGHSVDECNDF